jgi:heptosyltransferase II
MRRFRYNTPMPATQRIVVFLPNWIGDAVMATPALRTLRNHFSDARITLLGRPGPLQTLADAGFAEDTLDIGGRSTRAVLRIARALRRIRCDLAVLLPNSFRSALTAWLGRAERRAGYARDGRSWLLNDTLDPPRDPDGNLTPIPARDYYLALVEHLGCEPDSTRLDLAAEPAPAQTLLAEVGGDADRPLVVLNPGGANNLSKKWLPERFAAVGDALANRHAAQIVLHAAPAERDDARAVAQAMRTEPLLNFAARESSIPLAKSLIARADLVVTNDTGARHIAAGLGTAVVTVFISTDPEWSRIDYPRERIVTVNQPFQPVRPGSDEHRRAVEGVTIQAVLDAAEDLLATSEATA